MTSSKETQIFYIHGFGSTAESATLKMLQKTYPDAIGLDYAHNKPAASILSLAADIRKYNDKNIIVVGSSLGGWYTEQLTHHVVADFIMYNPAIQPEISLSKFGVSQQVLFSYKCLKKPLEHASRTVIISIDDLVIDPVLADNKYKDAADMVYTAGGHRMTEEAMNVITSKIKFLENQLTL